ncbi:MAG: hypothetical protein UT24_C0030G0008 [Candidatus Woesebacteria bacterium GW2011_GWB1_39_12]|uniref:Uncharacterized protein n=1 Tax=Candidatus Woesebacteria bacterium GW2011_GWB1_39_12 TaxID=1618574 RepID=A0A0G0MF04_9BACT|nr:MAG: hypothetical protein UT24_C0030G0008 [Candidatus Woesebacteria bacterium GW2011_GWB1_39_12]
MEKYIHRRSVEFCERMESRGIPKKDQLAIDLLFRKYLRAELNGESDEQCQLLHRRCRIALIKSLNRCK